MKHKTGCQSCRLRHRRCVFPKGASQCYGCLENGKECAPPPKFVFETYCHPQTPHSIVAPGSVTFTSTNDERCDENQPPPEIGDNVSPPLSTLSDDVGSLCAPISRTSPGLGLNEREGRLFLLYVRQLAPMMDSCDESRHFSLTVPRMALEKPLLLYSILALASRYDALHRNLPPDLEAIKYNHYCIEYLIDSLSKPPETYGPELLAAVVIARSYEECDFEADLSHHHLSGTSNLLTDETVARLASEGGLAEAACWVHLRQAIYAYLVRRRPVDRHIDAFKRLAMRNTTSDSAYTNSMVYCFARILRLFFPCTLTASQLTEDTWDTLEAEADIWFEKRRPSFEPIYTSENEEQGDFPSIMMMSAATRKPFAPRSDMNSANRGKQSWDCNTITLPMWSFSSINAMVPMPMPALERSRLANSSRSVQAYRK